MKSGTYLIIILIILLMMSILGGGLFTFPVFAASAVLFGLMAFRFLREKDGPITLPAPVIIAIAAIFLMLLSVCPLPGRLDAVTGLKRINQNNTVREAVSAAHRVGMAETDSAWFSATRNRAGTIRIIALSLLILAAGIATASMNERHRCVLLSAIIVIGVASAAFGYLHQWVYPKDRTIWWLIDTPRGHPVGAFINRTNHAGLLAVIAPLTLSWVMFGIYTNRPLRMFLGVTSFVVICLAVVSSLSRGAFVAICTGTVVFAMHSLFIAGRRKMALAIPLLILSLTTALFYSSHFIEDSRKSVITERISTLSDPLSTPSGIDRVNLWQDSMRIFLDYPMIGAGANGFRAVYPQYRDETYREAFTHTENEYLQILVDGGMIGVALFAILLLTIGIRWKKALRDKDMAMNIYGSGVIAGISAAAIHNLVDFPMHTPMYAMTLICMVSAVTSCRSDVITETADIRLKPAYLSALCVAAFVFSAGVPLAGGKAFTDRDQPAHMASASSEEAVKCLVWAPTSWQAWAQLSRCSANTADRNRYLLSVMCLDQAVQYDPNNYLLWQSVGIAKQSMGDTNGADKAFARMRQLRPWASIPQMKMENY